MRPSLRSPSLRSLTFAMLAAATLAPVSGTARAADGSSRTGFYMLDRLPERGAAALEIRALEGRRYAGAFAAGGRSCSVEGTAADSGATTAVGDCAPRSRIVLTGHDTEANRFGDDVPTVFSGGWTRTGPGSHESAELVLLEETDGPLDEMAGCWEGSLADGNGETLGRISAELATGGGGVLSVLIERRAELVTFDVLFDVVASTDADTPDAFAAVGGSEEGSLSTMTGRSRPEPVRSGGEVTILQQGQAGPTGDLSVVGEVSVNGVFSTESCHH